MIVAMQLEPRTLHRLIAARHLIDVSGQELSASSHPLAVAQKLLVAHDAAELVFIALKSQLNLNTPESDGKVKSESSFMAMARALLTLDAESGDKRSAHYIKLLEDLNRVRVAFKHHGILADALTNFHLFGDTRTILDSICSKFIGQSLTKIDEAAAIRDGLTKVKFDLARRAIEDGDYKASLELTASALAYAFIFTEARSSINAGVPSSIDALQLLGRGIDPASFLAMQQLLPAVYWIDGQAVWELREYGHPANWTIENAKFCLETAISTVVKLQETPQRPMPRNFYSEFEDVVEVLVDNPEVLCTKSDLDNPRLYSPPRACAFFGRGDRVRGHVSGCLEPDSNSPYIEEDDFEIASWIIVNHAASDCPAMSEAPWLGDALLFRRNEVSITYRAKDKVDWDAWVRSPEDF